MRKTRILPIDPAAWKNVLNACRFTVGKAGRETEPSHDFKIGILIAEHSPIRVLNVLWTWMSIPSWVATHWSRHKFEKFIRTQRVDRTGKKRGDQDAPVNFMGSANPQNLIDSFRKRLCRQASPETRELAVDAKFALLEAGEPELSRVLVPHCVYRGGCPELNPCRDWERFCKWALEEHRVSVQMTDIHSRYRLYEAWLKQGCPNG